MIKIKLKKKKKQIDDKWIADREQFEYIHDKISHLIPLPSSNPITNVNCFSTSVVSKNTKSVIRNVHVALQLSKKMKHVIKQTCHLTRFLYNQCVRLIKEEDYSKGELYKMLVKKETNIFRGTKYEGPLSKVPSSIKNEVIQDFLKAIKIQKKLVNKGKLKYFEMKFRKKNRDQNFVICKDHIKFISKNEIESFPTFWPHNLFCKKGFPEIKHDCRLVWTRTNKFFLIIPIDKNVQINENNDVCALDPGVRTFQTTYDNKGISYQFGNNYYYKKIKPLINVAQRMRDGWKRDFVNGEKRYRITENQKEKKGLKKVAMRVEQKIKNCLTDLRRKTANFLCSNYKTVIIPKFETQRMCQKRDFDGNWKRKTGKKTAEGLSRMGHYKFQLLLKAKGEQTGTNIIIGHERCSTKTCTNCLVVNDNVGSSEVFDCLNCGMTFGRDIQAARNILLINWDQTGHRLVPKRNIRIKFSSNVF